MQGSVENSPSYLFDKFLGISWALDMLGPKYTRVVNMPRFCANCILKILSILDVLSSKYAKVFNVCIRSQNMLYLKVLNKIPHRIYLTGF